MVPCGLFAGLGLSRLGAEQWRTRRLVLILFSSCSALPLSISPWTYVHASRVCVIVVVRFHWFAIAEGMG